MLTRQAAWAAHSTAPQQSRTNPHTSEVQSVSSPCPTSILHVFSFYQLWAFNHSPQVSHHQQDRILSYLGRSFHHPQALTVSKKSLKLHSKNCKSRTLHTSNPLPYPTLYLYHLVVNPCSPSPVLTVKQSSLKTDCLTFSSLVGKSCIPSYS